MCGIVGYVGYRRVLPVLLDGLKRLEYRGYDSAGVAWPEEGKIMRVRAKGKLNMLEEALEDFRGTRTTIGLGHTRWATHGEPTEGNAHPHSDCSGELVVVHNGIIENYYSLREELKRQGHVFSSDTDTEVIAHLVERYLEDDLELAVSRALEKVEGAYALGVLWSKQPDILIAARRQSPLVIGVAERECFMASDIPALLPYTNRVIFLEDGQMAILKGGSVELKSISKRKPLDISIREIKWDASMAEKAGFKHFMLKEIYEQPDAILNTFRGRIVPERGMVKFDEIGLDRSAMRKIKKMVLLACGTSWHAGLVGKCWIEKWARIPVEVELASEFRYRELLIDESYLTVPISQSGETADTLAGLRIARELGSSIISICNVLGSTITRESDGTIYTHAGPEIGVASTKAFTSQLTALYLLALYLAQESGRLSSGEIRERLEGLMAIPSMLEEGLSAWHDSSRALADRYYTYSDFLYLGRNLQFPIALEGALKLKEISYIHAEGYAAGEMKHGPIALIDRNMPVVALCPRDHVYEKMVSNIEEVRSRRGMVISVGMEGDRGLERISNDVVTVPRVADDLNPFIFTVPLQLIAYEIALARGCDVDQPRNLAKSVTVE